MTTLKEKIESIRKNSDIRYGQVEVNPKDFEWMINSLLECYVTLEMLEIYLNFSTDDLCGDDLIGDRKKTIRFEQKLKKIEQTFELLRKWSEGEN
jgi:hypothetical protein